MVPLMYDDFRVTSEPYRLMPPRKGARPYVREALDEVAASGSVREALDAASAAQVPAVSGNVPGTIPA
jgi:hypothetical protein